jgi:hypothetical protein
LLNFVIIKRATKIFYIVAITADHAWVSPQFLIYKTAVDTFHRTPMEVRPMTCTTSVIKTFICIIGNTSSRLMVKISTPCWQTWGTSVIYQATGRGSVQVTYIYVCMLLMLFVFINIICFLNAYTMSEGVKFKKNEMDSFYNRVLSKYRAPVEWGFAHLNNTWGLLNHIWPYQLKYYYDTVKAGLVLLFILYIYIYIYIYYIHMYI